LSEAQARWQKAALIVALLCSPWLLVQGWIVVGAPTPEHTTMPTCPDRTQNCASLSSEGVVRMEASLATVVDANISEVWSAWQAWSQEEGLVEVYDRTQAGGEHFSHRVAITPFWRFPDDVVVQFTPVGEAETSIELYSSSRLGKSDIGVNPDRLQALHAALIAA
jgi:hypothetical protein